MGCGVSADSGGPVNEAGRRVLEEQRHENEKVKLLLLGTGESGKSTIFKQMKILHGDPLTEDELAFYSSVVRANCVAFVGGLVRWMKKKGLTCKRKDERLAMATLLSAEDFCVDDKLVQENAACCLRYMQEMNTVWQSEEMQRVFLRERSNIHVMDSHDKYMNKFGVICHSAYRASQADVLMARTRTVGFRTERYTIAGVTFEMYDVGGQRYFRKKWLATFEDVDAIVFVASLSEYDQMLVEDASKNRMVEAIELFQTMINNEYFADTSMMLFLNKKDLFQEKISRVNIGDVPDFQDFMGRQGSFENGIQYFIDKFLACNCNESKDIYYHITCATDTNNIEFVWESCRTIILEESLKKSGIM